MTAVAAGTAFLCPEDWEGGRHLWFVISDPAISDDVVIANVSTLKGISCDDPTCVLEAGAHPFVTSRSCIRYDRCRIISAKELAASLETGERCKSQNPAENALLVRIQRGASSAPMIEPQIRSMMRKQGLAP